MSSVQDREVQNSRHSGIEGLKMARSLKVVEMKYTNAKFLKLNNCVEIFHHEPPSGTGLQ